MSEVFENAGHGVSGMPGEEPFSRVREWQLHPEYASPIAKELVLRKLEIPALFHDCPHGLVYEKRVRTSQAQEVHAKRLEVMDGVAQRTSCCGIQLTHVVALLPSRQPGHIRHHREAERRWNVKSDLDEQDFRLHQTQEVLGNDAIVAVNVHHENV